jgi:hypothetical protein
VKSERRLDDEAFRVDLEEVAELDVKQVTLVNHPVVVRPGSDFCGISRPRNFSLQMIEDNCLKQIILYSSFVSGSSNINNKKNSLLIKAFLIFLQSRKPYEKTDILR